LQMKTRLKNTVSEPNIENEPDIDESNFEVWWVYWKNQPFFRGAWISLAFLRYLSIRQRRTEYLTFFRILIENRHQYPVIVFGAKNVMQWVIRVLPNLRSFAVFSQFMQHHPGRELDFNKSTFESSMQVFPW